MVAGLTKVSLEEVHLAVSLAKCFSDKGEQTEGGNFSVGGVLTYECHDLVEAINRAILNRNADDESESEFIPEWLIYEDFYGKYLPGCINWDPVKQKLPEVDVFLVFNYGAIDPSCSCGRDPFEQYDNIDIDLIAFVDNRHHFGVDVAVVYAGPAFENEKTGKSELQTFYELILENFAEVLESNPEKGKEASKIRITSYDAKNLQSFMTEIPKNIDGIKIIYESIYETRR